MSFFKFFCPVLIALYSISALKADDCSFIRLDQKKLNGDPGSMTFVPHRDQENWGICYAEAAAQMVDAYRFSRLGDSSHIPSSEISAVFDTYPVDSNMSSYSMGGTLCGAVEEMRANGIQDRISALECVVKSQSPARVAGVQALFTPIAAKMNAIKSAKDNAFKAGDYNTYLSLSKTDTTSADLRAGLISLGYEAPQIPNDSTLQDLLKADSGELIWALSLYSCAATIPRTVVSVPVCMRASPQRDQDYISLWNDRLTRPNPQPIGVEFCAGVLIDGKSYAGAKPSRTECSADSTGATDLGHAILLIGRRMSDAGKCQYLLRNSWGSVCSYSQYRSHPAGLSPSKPVGPQPAVSGLPGKDQIYSADWTCDQGDVWVDGDVLAKSTKDVEWFNEN